MPEVEAIYREERVLVLAPTGRDAVLTQDLLRQAGLGCDICPDMGRLCAELRQGAGALVLAEEALDAPSSKALLDELENQAPWSDPPLVVLTGQDATELTHRMARGLGRRTSVTLLERPVQSLTMVSAVQSALRARRRQYQVRDLVTQLETGVRDRDRFLAMLSHELRNPLATILGALAISDEGTNGAGFEREQRQIVARQARHLARLIDDLLDVSRVTAGKIVLEQKVVDLKEVAHRSLQAVQSAASARGHEVSVTTCPEAACVSGDSTRLEQVLTNLLTNAIKYTPPGGHIRLTIRTAKDQAVVSIRDDGIGIAQDCLQRVFEPFMQVDHSLDRAQGGLGLGLSLVRRLVEMHGGAVSATSAGLDKGSEFMVRLPRVAAPASAPAREPERPATVGRRVLLVEDGADTRRVMERLLHIWGHTVETAQDGPEGVRKAVELHPEIAVVDIGLPGIDGYEVARRIRSQCHDRIYLIALTGYGQTEDRERTAAAGFDLHLVKPVEPAVLQQALNHRSLQQVEQV